MAFVMYGWLYALYSFEYKFVEEPSRPPPPSQAAPGYNITLPLPQVVASRMEAPVPDVAILPFIAFQYLSPWYCCRYRLVYIESDPAFFAGFGAPAAFLSVYFSPFVGLGPPTFFTIRAVLFRGHNFKFVRHGLSRS